MIPLFHAFTDATWAWDIALASSADQQAIAARQTRRLAALVAYARDHSPYYRELYRDLPDTVADLGALPPVSKISLMDNFDRWVSDRAVTLESVEAFVSDRSGIGHLYHDRYAVWRSSGTSGHLGLFLHDRDALTVYDRLFMLRAWGPIFARPEAIGFWGHGGRMACITASEDHFAGISSWRRLAHAHPGIEPVMRDFSVMVPLDRLVAELNAWQPAQLVAYPSVLALLAHEQQEGRLQLSPSFAFAGGECLDAQEHDLIEQAFGCVVRDIYACAECDYVAFGCQHRSLHVNADWIIIEPVDETYRPVSAGVASHSCLVTNLANRIQPIIRYDLGDSVTEVAEPCLCGSPLPAIRVEGRRNQALRFRRAGGEEVLILPMAITTVLELINGLRRFQIIQTGEAEIFVGCEFEVGADRRSVCDKVRSGLAAFLAGRGLAHVSIKEEPATLEPDRQSGKFRQVVSRVDR